MILHTVTVKYNNELSLLSVKIKQYNAANGGINTTYVKNSYTIYSNNGMLYYNDIANDLLTSHI